MRHVPYGHSEGLGGGDGKSTLCTDVDRHANRLLNAADCRGDKN